MIDRFRSAYRLDLRAGAVHIARGRPPQGFVSAVRDIARLHGIRRGHIECKGSGRYARLTFSRDFPERGRQAIRNVWTPPTISGPGGGSRASG